MTQNQSLSLEKLSADLVAALGDRIVECKLAFGEVNLIGAAGWA